MFVVGVGTCVKSITYYYKKLVCTGDTAPIVMWSGKRGRVSTMAMGGMWWEHSEQSVQQYHSLGGQLTI